MARGSVLSDRVVEPSGSLSAAPPPPTSSQKIPPSDLNAILEEMQKQLKTLKQEHSAIHKRVVMVRQTIDGLVSVFGQNSIGEDLRAALKSGMPKPSGPGLSRICCVVLAQSSRGLTVAELLVAMQQKHPALLADNKNPKASLTTVLNRLLSCGAVQGMSDERGAKVWLYTSSSEETKLPPSGRDFEGIAANRPGDCSCSAVHPELVRACRIALMETREVASPEQIYSRIVRRASFSFEGIEHPFVAIAEALGILAEEARDQNPNDSFPHDRVPIGRVLPLSDP
jgi:hypothetical protein